MQNSMPCETQSRNAWTAVATASSIVFRSSSVNLLNTKFAASQFGGGDPMPILSRGKLVRTQSLNNVLQAFLAAGRSALPKPQAWPAAS
jgi:hypothetical protein